jgi:hypothetical protein
VIFFLFREFTNYSQNAKNSINIVKTLALKHQKNLASRSKIVDTVPHMYFTGFTFLEKVSKISWIS